MCKLLGVTTLPTNADARYYITASCSACGHDLELEKIVVLDDEIVLYVNTHNCEE